MPRRAHWPKGTPLSVDSVPSVVNTSTSPHPATHAFARVHKTALGVAVGLVVGLGILAVTVFHVVLRPTNGPPIELLSQFFYGYTVSWGGAAVGLCWGFFAGFVAGWFAAFVHNLVTAITVLVFKTRGELEHTKDFLDHI